jgi:cyclohexanone monooxygenase
MSDHSEPAAAARRPAPDGEGQIDVIVVGAGFAGLALLHRLRAAGLRVVAIEAGDDVGGTWYWNRYPGARCDVESLEYSFGFDDDLQQEWCWAERYAPQPEILRYLGHVADRFDLRRDIRFRTRVTGATFDEAREQWQVDCDDGSVSVAPFLVLATGCLSMPTTPRFPGDDSFAGATYHTGRWPAEGVDVSGLRVGVIGTGSSGVQSIPLLAQQASRLVVFQRTPSYCVPAHNDRLDPDEEREVKRDYPAFRAANRTSAVAFGSRWPANDVSALAVSPSEREAMFERRWAHGGLPFLGAFNDLLLDPAANELAAEFVRTKIRQTVRDPAVAERLCPDTVIGCKRLCVDTGYYATYNLPHVELVDVRATPIEAITPSGIRVGDVEHELDVIVFATGFDAMTGAIRAIDPRGRDGRRLTDAWEEGPRTLLGLMTAGFPNLFTVTGPGSPSVLTNMVVSIEHHAQWITDCLVALRDAGDATIEPTVAAQDEWVTWVNTVADLTLYPTCNSWYLGANVPGKPRVFMPLIGFPPYEEHCAAVAATGYPGFERRAGASLASA